MEILRDKIHLGGVFMQKIGIVTALVIWLLLAGRLISNDMSQSTNVAEVFNSFEFEEIDAQVTAFGKYGITHLTEDEKEQILRELAAGIGLEEPYYFENVENKENVEKILTKTSKNADTIIKVVTCTEYYDTYYETTHYIEILLDLKGNLNCAVSYKELIEEVLSAQEIDARVMINLQGSVEGALNYDEKNSLADGMLKALDATVQTENRGNDLFTIYAYSNMVDESVVCAGRKININIAQEYDEIANRTIIYLSTPFNNLDY